jgi:hypothetical protein
MGPISDLCGMFRFLRQTEYNGVTTEGLLAVWADHDFDTERGWITVLESARAIVFHGSLHSLSDYVGLYSYRQEGDTTLSGEQRE